jgi:hypothetical protein
MRGLIRAAAPGLLEGEREMAVVEFEAQDGVEQGGHFTSYRDYWNPLAVLEPGTDFTRISR